MPRRSAGGPAPGSVRIIAGEWRGRRLAIPPTGAVRPTPDRVRETVFNWLGPFIEGAKCLDLYAGTGALGFEALSRGAAEAWLVERDPRLAEALRRHATTLGASAQVLQADAARLLTERTPAAESFGGFAIVFLDPPYETPLEPLLEKLPPFVTPDTLVYVERARKAGLPEAPGGTWFKRGHAGAVVFGLLALSGG